MVWREDIPAYEQFCEAHAAAIPLFYQREWLSAVVTKGDCRFWVAEEKGAIIAIFAGHYRKKYGLSALLMPRLTPYLGIWTPLMNNDPLLRELSTNLLAALPGVFFTSLCLHPDIKDVMPWKWKGLHEQSRFTYLIRQKDVASYHAGVQAKLNNHIRFAASRLKIKEQDDVEVLTTLVKDSFGQQGLAIPYPESILLNILHCKAAATRITVAVDENENPHAALLTVEDGKTVYNLVSGRKSDAVRGAIPLLLNHAIENALINGKSFDFEGSSIQRIATFFESFGGELTSFYHIYGSTYRLADALIALTGKYKAG